MIPAIFSTCKAENTSQDKAVIIYVVHLLSTADVFSLQWCCLLPEEELRNCYYTYRKDNPLFSSW